MLGTPVSDPCPNFAYCFFGKIILYWISGGTSRIHYCVKGEIRKMSSEVNKVSRDLTSGPLAKQILVFSIPLVLSNLLQVLFNMSDIAVVGQFAGSHALGSVGSTTTLVTLFTTFLIGVSGGVNVMTAQYIGAKKDKDVREVVHSAAWMCALMGVILLLFGQVFSKLILEVMKTKEELIDGAALYLRIYFLGMPALGIYNFGNAVFSAVGDTKKPVYILAFSGVVNILLNLFFVIVCRLSVAGVAIASVTSQYMSAVLRRMREYVFRQSILSSIRTRQRIFSSWAFRREYRTRYSSLPTFLFRSASIRLMRSLSREIRRQPTRTRLYMMSWRHSTQPAQASWGRTMGQETKRECAAATS